MQRYVFYWKRKNPFPKSVINDKNREWKWLFMVLLENGVIRLGHMENNLNNFYNK